MGNQCHGNQHWGSTQTHQESANHSILNPPLRSCRFTGRTVVNPAASRVIDFPRRAGTTCGAQRSGGGNVLRCVCDVSLFWILAQSKHKQQSLWLCVRGAIWLWRAPGPVCPHRPSALVSKCTQFSWQIGSPRFGGGGEVLLASMTFILT